MPMDFAGFHPYVYYATRYPFSKGQSNVGRICYGASLYLIGEGKGVVHTCGRAYETGPGSLVYMPAGQPHDWYADRNDPMVHVCCYFDWTLVARRHVFPAPSIICYDKTQLKPELIGPAFPYPIPELMKVDKPRLWIDLFESFYTNNQFTNERTYYRSLKTQSHFQQFIAYFLAFALKEEHMPDPRLTRLLERLDRDLLSGVVQPLEAYYRELRISRGYFFELFRAATGLSPVQYINRFRINRAKEDLRFTALSVTEIAEKHGFSSVHYFSKLFSQLAGVSPREFREEGRS